MIKAFAPLGFALLCSTAVAHAAEVPPPASLAQDGTLTYGVAATFAPFEYKDGTKLVGLDIELGELLAAKMGLVTEPLNMEFQGLIPALQGKRIDIINSAMYMNEERAEQVDFVPYLTVGNEVVVRAGNPTGVTGREDVCGSRIAVTLGGIQESYARADAARCAEEGRDEVTVITLPTAQDSALSVRSGRADVFYNSTPGTAKLMAELPGVFERVGESFEANTRVGIAVRKGETDTATAIQAALDALVADGSYAALLDRYMLPDSAALLLK
ncbi:ABC transporter substrate-binding protein [Roseospira marina]|uniref:ABC transporter substrate-binding protein n=1 Tax=Roseospira marina TaxID=140057 RepID=A0A5M6IF78_9PROT|nr:ABC transporter substrate-binding protein [Roseospira marina]KAA5606597.1 ABC transporter substrate-binding protein [Roseospira marina]MBB4314003.1 polar amino acid transport system substrate-binding protein [Roseospira marina]MBB5087165.1 polar amino acid transport system substrate-binding protein [Roseospira marina]